jgi:quercetin dioxygenase-like cupin family protein
MFNALMLSRSSRQRAFVSATRAAMLARRRFLQVVGAAVIPVGSTGWAEPSLATPKLTQVLKADLLGQNQKVQETVVNVLEMAPAAAAPWHMHPGAQEIIFVLEGNLTVDVEGHGPREIKAGGIILVPAETPHLTRNSSIATTRALVTHSRADKEKPFLIVLKEPT